jgi:hypothetical protein
MQLHLLIHNHTLRGTIVFPEFNFKEHTIWADLKRIRPIPLAVPSKAWLCIRLIVGIAGSNTAGGMVFVSCVCCLFCR